MAPLPARDEVHCWYVDLDVPPEAEAGCYATLADGERSRSARFRFDRDRRRFVVAHGALRRLLGRYLGTYPGRLDFVLNEFGKPELRPGFGPRLHFNLSHSAELAVIAVAHAEVGVDVERIRELPDYEEVARSQFPATDVERLRALPSRHRVLAFFRCWVAKEAHVKARGEALAMPAATLAAPSGEWSLHALQPAPGYVGALVIRGSGRRLAERRWPADSLAEVPEPCETLVSPW